MQAIGSIENQVCLDVGCGGGFFTHKMYACGGKVTGIDYAETGILFGKSRYPQLDLRVQSGFDITSFGEKYFDVVTLIDVIEHVHDQQTLLKDIYTILKPGGRMVISTDAEQTMWACTPFGRIFRALERFSANGQAMRLIQKVEALRRSTKNYHQGHVGCLTAKQLSVLVEQAGFQVITHTLFPLSSMPIRDMILRLLPQRFHGDHQVIVAKKP